MVEIYCKLIVGKRKTFHQIPENHRHQVQTRLEELGYDTNGDPIVKD